MISGERNMEVDFQKSPDGMSVTIKFSVTDRPLDGKAVITGLACLIDFISGKANLQEIPNGKNQCH